MEFNKHKIGEFIDTISDTTPIDKEKVILINTSDVENGYVLNHNYVDNKKLKGQFKKRFKKGDILYSEIRPRNKRFAYVDFESEDYIASTKLMVLRNKGNINNDFLFQLLKSDKIINHLQMLAESRSGTFPQITFNELSNIVVCIPETKTQESIANFLQLIDKKIELNNQINNNLQELLNKVFIKWFCEYDYPNETDQPYKSSEGKMIESELGEIPENWRVGVLQDIIDFSNGYGFKSNDLLDNEDKETYKVFKQGNINLSGGINEEKTKSWIYKEKTKGLEKFILKKGDILMCMTDMKNSTSPLLGHTALMNVDDEYIVNQRVGLIRCKKEITDYPYVYTMSNLEYFLKDIRSRANSGVQVNLSTKGICETKIIIPDKRVLNKYNEFAIPLYEMMFKNQKENQDLEQLRDTLLPKLMNGEIDIDKIVI